MAVEIENGPGELSELTLEVMAESGYRLEDWVLSPEQAQSLACASRARFDLRLDVRAAHFLNQLEKTTPALLVDGFGIAWCRGHQGWEKLEAFSRDARGANGLQGACKSCQSVRRKRRYQSHRDEELLSRAAWRAQPGNAERDNARRSEYTRQNPQQEAARKMARRRRQQAGQIVDPGQQGWFTRDQRRLRERLRHRCQGCGERVPARQGFDHLLPYARGGQHRPGNLWLLCTSCNSSKRDRTWMEWRMWRRRRGLKDVLGSSPRRAPVLP